MIEIGTLSACFSHTGTLQEVVALWKDFLVPLRISPLVLIGISKGESKATSNSSLSKISIELYVVFQFLNLFKVLFDRHAKTAWKLYREKPERRAVLRQCSLSPV